MISQNLNSFAADLLDHDPQGHGKAQLAQELSDMDASLKRTLDRGVSPDQAEEMAVVRDAVAAAGNILDHVWNDTHQ